MTIHDIFLNKLKEEEDLSCYNVYFKYSNVIFRHTNHDMKHLHGVVLLSRICVQIAFQYAQCRPPFFFFNPFSECSLFLY